MCVVSMIMDHYGEHWGPRIPSWPQQPVPFLPEPPHRDWTDIATRLEALRNKPPGVPAITPEEIAEFRTLLERARNYDRRNHEPDCELDEKRQAIIAIAKQLGVEIAFL